jgi:hypothetical protein
MYRCFARRLAGRSLRLAAAAALAAALFVSSAPGARAQTAPIPGSITEDFKSPLHAVVTVEVNDKGQVSKIRSMQSSKNEKFNLNVYGNAAQMFIRKPDGSAIAGVYDVTYDYDPSAPKDKAISRKVSLVQAGGVDGSAPGLVTKYRSQSPAPAASK